MCIGSNNMVDMCSRTYCSCMEFLPLPIPLHLPLIALPLFLFILIEGCTVLHAYASCLCMLLAILPASMFNISASLQLVALSPTTHLCKQPFLNYIAQYNLKHAKHFCTSFSGRPRRTMVIQVYQKQITVSHKKKGSEM